jgi:hypothetical protein
MTLSITTNYYYAECHYAEFLISIVMLNIIMLSVVIIIPDILITLMTRACWRQNTFTLNNLRLLAPKCFQSTSLEVLLPFNVIDPILK